MTCDTCSTSKLVVDSSEAFERPFMTEFCHCLACKRKDSKYITHGQKREHTECVETFVGVETSFNVTI